MGKVEQSNLLIVAAVCLSSMNSLIAKVPAMAAPAPRTASAPPAAPLKTKAGTEVTKDKDKGLVSTTSENKTPSYNPKALHRLDFKITGKSCAVCLLGIQKRMSSVPGAVKAAVQLQAPYAAVVLYDSSKTTQKALLDKAQETEPTVKFVSIEDNAIAKVPIVLVPKIGNEVLDH